MKAWIIAASFALASAPTWGIAPALAEPGAPEQARPAQAAEESANADIIIAHGTNTGKGIDPKLAPYKRNLEKPPLNSYNSYAFLGDNKLSLTRGKATNLKLPDGGELKLTLDAVEVKKDKPKRYVFTASLKGPQNAEFLPGVQLKAQSGRHAFLAGYPYQNGILVLGLAIHE
jgi:hypothetical protein